VVDFGLFGGVCGQSFAKGDVAAQMQGIADFVLGFKTYFISGMESFARLNHYQFTAVLLKAKELGLPVLLHAEDYDYVQAATEREMREGDGPLNYYRSRPETAEILAVGAAVQLASETGADLHIVHIGSARAGELIGAPNVSGETAPHYLAFELEDFARMGSVLKCTPPVKGPGNREGLWRLLAEGRIDFVASDHAPCRREEKHTGSIWTDYAGMPGCGVLLPYMFSEGFVKGRLTLRRLLEITSENAARRYGIFNRKGSIEPGKDGDFALINPKESWTVRGGEFSSKGKVTPFEGIRLRGKVSMTILRGETIYTQEKGVVGEAGAGRLVRRSDQAG
jgi:allantoinase